MRLYRDGYVWQKCLEKTRARLSRRSFRVTKRRRIGKASGNNENVRDRSGSDLELTCRFRVARQSRASDKGCAHEPSSLARTRSGAAGAGSRPLRVVALLSRGEP